MANNNLKIDLTPRVDKDQNIFYVGKLKVPANLELKNGVTFIIFTSQSGSETLEICGFSEKDKEE